MIVRLSCGKESPHMPWSALEGGSFQEALVSAVAECRHPSQGGAASRGWALVMEGHGVPQRVISGF